MKRKIFAGMVALLAVFGISLATAGPANADVVFSFGHKNWFYNAQGLFLSNTNSSGAMFRVGIEVRGLGTSGNVNQFDVNVCVQPLSGGVARTSVNTVWLFADGHQSARSDPQRIVGAPTTNCADLDPNRSVRDGAATWIGETNVSVRRTDNVLVTPSNSTSQSSTQSWDENP